MKKTLFTLLFSLAVLSLPAQDAPRNIYSGGMLFFQPGYTMSANPQQEIGAGSSAIGGILRLYFGRCFTAGIYGGSQKSTYASAGSENSYIHLGYGGPFIGLSARKGRFRYTLSAFAGKGTVRNLHIEEQTGEILNEAYLYKAGTWVLAPLVSVDFALTQRIMLSTQATWLRATWDGNRLDNPTFQLGILFNR